MYPRMPLQVQLLPTSAGDPSQSQPLTTYLLNDTIAIDAGSLGFALPPAGIAKIHDIVLTHAHLDHTASLPVAIDSAYVDLTCPMRVHAAAPTLAAVRKHLFNDDVWVDFSEFPLHADKTKRCMEWVEMPPRIPLQLDGVRLTPIPVNHTVPTVGLLIESPTDSIVITSDTWRTDEIWQAAGKLPNLRAVFVECSFPDEYANLAERSGHLTPKLVAEETAKMNRAGVAVYCVHLKPSMRSRLQSQLAPYASRGISQAEIGKVYRWG